MKKKKTSVKKAPVIPYDSGLRGRLKDPSYAVTYLANSWDQSGDPDEEFHAFFTALEEIVKAHGIQSVAAEMEMSRDALYKIFTDHKNPKALTLVKLLHAIGFAFTVVPITSAVKRA